MCIRDRQWPEAARVKPEISPATQTRPPSRSSAARAEATSSDTDRTGWPRPRRDAVPGIPAGAGEPGGKRAPVTGAASGKDSAEPFGAVFCP